MAVVMVSAIALLSSQPTSGATRQIKIYNSADSASVLEMFLPDNPTGRAVIDCPGGGYATLAMNHEGYDWVDFFTSRGIAFGILTYRMPHGDRNIPLSDAYNALKTVRDSAEVWHINPYDVGIMGFSAGGHLASAVSTHAPAEVRPNFSILFYPVISMNEQETHRGSCEGFLGDERHDEATVNRWSSDKAVRRHLTPPAILLTAEDDDLVPTKTNSLRYYNAMRNAGLPCALYIYPSGGHGFGFKPNFPYHEQMLCELSTWLQQLPTAKADAIRVACIGNSITDGHGIDMSSINAYPGQLQRMLGDGYNVKNYGVGARTMLNHGDHPYMQEDAWRHALAFNPNIVVIKLGTNDSKPKNWVYGNEFKADMQQMIDSLKSLPAHPKIYLATPITAYSREYTINDSVITNNIIPIINQLARTNKLEIIDLHTQFNNDDNRQMLPDGIHPTMEGDRQIAGIIAKAIAPDTTNAKQ
jgi:acetyl esterase/lipase/lysophospholipase L1-like esterase